MKRIMAVMLSMALMGCVIGAQAQQDTHHGNDGEEPAKESGYQEVRADCFRAAK